MLSIITALTSLRMIVAVAAAIRRTVDMAPQCFYFANNGFISSFFLPG
ncbi:MAG: hypothetical protein ABIL58_06275 [Pseudomonadota bacterium]